MLNIRKFAFRCKRNCNQMHMHSQSNLMPLNGTSRSYIENLYINWLKDKSSVDKQWQTYFTSVANETPSHISQPSNAPTEPKHGFSDVSAALKIETMVNLFRKHGHREAKVDPLAIGREPGQTPLQQKKLKPYDLDALIEAQIHPLSLNADTPEIARQHGLTSTRELVQRLREVYCGEMGFEFDHIEEEAELRWLYGHVEGKDFRRLDKASKTTILDRLAWSSKFERFLALKWSTQKRFGLEGTESMIAGIKALVDTAANAGLRRVVIGMPHRGRLNVLANVLRKPVEMIFAEFDGSPSSQRLGAPHSGDVKYHMGFSCTRTTRAGKEVGVTLVANPSHLEAVNPVVLGKTRSKQEFAGQWDKKGSMALLIHGDASFYGQGVVYESLMLNDFHGFETGGAVHVICNNQIGYTTDPTETRRAMYCTDVAKSFGAPIIHVNAENAEAVVAAFGLAAEFRQKFGKDVVVDLVGFRRYGHNEADEPRFTQPLMYGKISEKPDHFTIYANSLLQSKEFSKEEIAGISDRVQAMLESSFKKSKNLIPAEADWLERKWSGFNHFEKVSSPQKTGVDIQTLRSIGMCAVTVPDGFKLHHRLEMVLNLRKKALETGENVDWGLAEALALGSLVLQSVSVRLTGQDVERGTFSHRHAVLVHQSATPPQKSYVPLLHLKGRNADYTVLNSPLSEFGVLGFEYGYSTESPNTLVIWEAQFGDFANEAQVIFDQFISSAEAKWLRQSGIVVLLPHSYEGGGPEHSSARMERFLQMCKEDTEYNLLTDEDKPLRIQKCNWQVLNCSTPANYFHALRRQICRNFRKPLVVFSPKSLLKLRECVSPLADFSGEAQFKWLIPERAPGDLASPNAVRKIIFCSGKIYYELVAERKRRNLRDVAVVTLEQLSPFPYEEVLAECRRYENAKIMWAQEEPKNMGAYTYIQPRLKSAIESVRKGTTEIIYAGRPPSAATATGFGMKLHKIETENLLKDSMEKY